MPGGLAPVCVIGAATVAFTPAIAVSERFVSTHAPSRLFRDSPQISMWKPHSVIAVLDSRAVMIPRQTFGEVTLHGPELAMLL